jgi:hypothetical protein
MDALIFLSFTRKEACSPSTHFSCVLDTCLLHTWWQVKVKKSETDLVIDQLHEVFIQLGKEKVSVSKFEKRLEDVRHKWDDIKKAHPQVKTDVEPIQVCWALSFFEPQGLWLLTIHCVDLKMSLLRLSLIPHRAWSRPMRASALRRRSRSLLGRSATTRWTFASAPSSSMPLALMQHTLSWTW